MKKNKFWISMSFLKMIIFIILSLIILFSLFEIGIFIVFLISLILWIYIFCTTTIILFSNEKLVVNNVKILIKDIKEFSFSYRNSFFNKRIFLTIMYNEKEISIPIYRFSKSQIEKIVEELSKRTNNYKNNLNDCIIEIINNEFHKKFFRIKIFIISIMAINGIILHDYLFRPFIYIDNEIWFNGKIDQLKYCKEEYFPKIDEVGDYETYNFHVFLHSDALILNSRLNSFCLELVYSEENYDIEVKRIIENVNFLTEPKKNLYYDEWLMPVIELNIGEFLIKIIDISNYSISMPFIAFDGNRIIRYCYQHIGGLSMLKDEYHLKKNIVEGFIMDW